MAQPLWIQVAQCECSRFSRYAGRKSATRATRHRVGRAEHNPSLNTPRSTPFVQRLVGWTLWHQHWPRAAMGCPHSSRGGTVILPCLWCTHARSMYVLTSDECFVRSASGVGALCWLAAAAPIRLASCGPVMMTWSVPVTLPAPCHKRRTSCHRDERVEQLGSSNHGARLAVHRSAAAQEQLWWATSSCRR